MNKQIEEMANIIRDNENACQATQCPNCKYEKCDYTICIHMLAAETLYTAGYRKASEVASEIFEEIEEIFTPTVSSLFKVSETLVDVSKSHISEEKAIKDIRNYLKMRFVRGINYATHLTNSKRNTRRKENENHNNNTR